ncbi:MAG: UDP-N-acetylglucosamine--N-acetylmuramyl-(pentapeptide) pyrophosphoryl-undecaprenol N-acetylglucosamine transferase [Planctomycetaceae bacterium]|nr:UDP-N-acetylglucosamine--N-acetylmuramyl-(pentapeptide) pyrophosphoryl-undecaprenol N-acetylglucosamine transferase [Planctomycetaceae bacterium]
MPSPPEWNLIVCGGGSGGHLYPALAVVEELRERLHPPREILCLTSSRGIDANVLTDWALDAIPLAAPTGRAMVRRPWSLWKPFQRARDAIRTRRPAIALGTGGYASVPGILAARSLGVPIVLLEQNAVLGQATSVLRRLATETCVSFPSTVTGVCETGNPVRRQIAELAEARPQPKSSKTLLVLGGSQGSRAVSEAMTTVVQCSPELFDGWDVIHQAPADSCEEAARLYGQLRIPAKVAPFFPDLPDIYRRTTLAISRAGGTTLAELACAGIPAILVPFPGSIRDHQFRNAQYFVDRSAATIVEETPNDTFAVRIHLALQTCINDDAVLASTSQAMQTLARPYAAGEVADLLDQIAAISL